MKFRPYAVLGALLASVALDVAVIAPAQAAPPPDVTNVQVTGQSQGAARTWSIAASWDAAATADGYKVAIVDSPTGDNTPGSYYGSTDTNGLSATISARGLLSSHTYWVSVRPTNGTEIGNPTTVAFQPIALDTAGPVGTYTLNRTKVYLTATDFEEEEFLTADVRIAQQTLSDDHTANAQIVRQVLSGDGSPAKTWSGIGTYKVVYLKKGTYSPKVLLTDSFGNVTTVNLPTVQVLEDVTAPVVRLTRPGPLLIDRLGGWRSIRGTVTDVGSGVQIVLVMVVEKRGSIWWAYDFDSSRWMKGFRSRDKTMEELEASPAAVEPNGKYWRTPRIRDLRAGLLHAEIVAFDGSFNVGYGPTVHRWIH